MFYKSHKCILPHLFLLVHNLVVIFMFGSSTLVVGGLV